VFTQQKRNTSARYDYITVTSMSVLRHSESIQKIIELILDKMLSYHRETALQGALALAKSGRLEIGE